jgi:hypothetical protein
VTKEEWREKYLKRFVHDLSQKVEQPLLRDELMPSLPEDPFAARHEALRSAERGPDADLSLVETAAKKEETPAIAQPVSPDTFVQPVAPPSSWAKAKFLLFQHHTEGRTKNKQQPLAETEEKHQKINKPGPGSPR